MSRSYLRRAVHCLREESGGEIIHRQETALPPQYAAAYHHQEYPEYTNSATASSVAHQYPHLPHHAHHHIEGLGHHHTGEYLTTEYDPTGAQYELSSLALENYRLRSMLMGSTGGAAGAAGVSVPPTTQYIETAEGDYAYHPEEAAAMAAMAQRNEMSLAGATSAQYTVAGQTEEESAVAANPYSVMIEEESDVHEVSGAAAGGAGEEAVQKLYLCNICKTMVFVSYDEVKEHQETCGIIDESRVGAADQLMTEQEAEHHHHQMDLPSLPGVRVTTEVDEHEVPRQVAASALLNAQYANPSRLPAIKQQQLEDPAKDVISELPKLNGFRPEPNTSPAVAWPKEVVTIPLAMKEDDMCLIPIHCFVRKHCLHIFRATIEDTIGRKVGKGKPVTLNQIGICCPHCLVTYSRQHIRGAVYFPSTVSQIYSASLNLLQRHLPTCIAMPKHLREAYDQLKQDEGRSGSSKQYWLQSAIRLGLVDTEYGIRYVPQQWQDPEKAAKNDISSCIPSLPPAPADKDAPIVIPEDQNYTTEYAYYLMSQAKRCYFSQADKIGKRRGCTIGFPGIACKYCKFLGRLFPTSFKSFSDSSKTLDKMHNHLLKCRETPLEVKSALIRMKAMHYAQKSKMKFGLMKMFFARVWERIHECYDPCSLTNNSSSTTTTSPITPKNEKDEESSPDIQQQQPESSALYAAGEAV